MYKFSSKSKLTRTLALTGLVLLIGGGLIYWKTAFGVTRTWDGGGTDGTCGGAGTANNWSCAANWSADTAPTGSDIATFDGTSTKNATINANISVAGINIAAGYSGTITQSSTYTVTVGSSHFVQAAGTFTGGSGLIDINGTFTLSGGTFTSTTGILEVGRVAASETLFTVSSGTFNHNNGTVTFAPIDSGNNGYSFTVDVATTLTLYDIVVNCSCSTGGANGLFAASGDTIIATNNFTHTDGLLRGAWEVQGNVIIGSGADGGAGTLTFTGSGSKTYTYTAGGIGPHLRINNASISVSAAGGSTALRVALFSLIDGIFTAPTGTMTIGRNASSETFFTVSGGTFNHNNGSVTFAPDDGSNNGYTFTADVVTSLILYDVVINCPYGCSAGGGSITTAGGDTIVAAHDFSHTNGRLNGTWEVQGNYTVGVGADGGTAGLTFTGGNNQTYTDNGGNEVDGDVTVNKSGGTVTLASNADWNAASQDLTITAGTLAQSSYNITTNNFTVNGGTFTGGSGTIDVNRTFTLSSGTFTSTSGTLTISDGNNAETILTISGSGTFNHNSGTIVFSSGGGSNVTQTIDVNTSLTLYNVTINGFDGADTFAVAGGDTIIATGDFTHTNATFTGTWEVQGNVTIASSADLSSGTLTMTGTGSKTYTYAAGGAGPHLRVNNASLSVSANGGTTDLSIYALSVLAGAFTAPTGTLTVNSSNASSTILTVSSGATFIHNSGTIVFSSGSGSNITQTIDVNASLTLYDVTINGTDNGDAFAVAGGDTIIAAGNFTHTNATFTGTWEVQGNYTVGAGADGSTAGITFTGGNTQIYTDQGGNEPDGDVTINKTANSVTLASNADWNAASQDLTITAGTLLQPSNYAVATGAVTVGASGKWVNSGTGAVTLGGAVANAGLIDFRSSNTCGGSDTIALHSSSNGVQRAWSGAGTFVMRDIEVKDQGGSAAITAYSSTNTSGNGGNWTFSGAACPTVPTPKAGLPSGYTRLQGGKVNLR